MTLVEPWVVEFTEKHFGKAPFKIGDIIVGPNGKTTVKIVGGQYWGTYGISNFWSYRTILPDGSVSKRIRSGYGWRP